MTNYSKFEGKIIRMNKPYPITNDEDEILGYTEVGDMAVITFAEIKNKIGYSSESKSTEAISPRKPDWLDNQTGTLEDFVNSLPIGR